MMADTIVILKSILEEYERKVAALRAALYAVESSAENDETEEEEPHNVVIKNPPFDFSKIKDMNTKGGGIRADI